MIINIVQLDRSLPDGVVITAHWTAALTDGEFAASSYGTCSFEQKDPDDPDFIPYNELTEEIVEGWVQNKIGAEVEANLESQIHALKNPTSATGLPWNEQ